MKGEVLKRMNCLLFGIALKLLRKLSFCKKNTEVVKIQLVRLINANYHINCGV